jgi:hypothetical protein
MSQSLADAYAKTERFERKIAARKKLLGDQIKALYDGKNPIEGNTHTVEVVTTYSNRLDTKGIRKDVSVAIIEKNTKRIESRTIVIKEKPAVVVPMKRAA